MHFVLRVIGGDVSTSDTVAGRPHSRVRIAQLDKADGSHSLCCEGLGERATTADATATARQRLPGRVER
jgi:hypothetical protein